MSKKTNGAAQDEASGLRKGLTSYGDSGFSLFLRKAFIKGAGYTDGALDRPVIGIANTGSSYNPCHGNAPQLLEAVKRGIMFAGGLPMDFPTISIHESFSFPTSMYLRNLMAIVLIMNLLGMASMIPIVAIVKERGGPDWLVGLVLTGTGVGGVLGALISPRVTVAPARLMVAVPAIFGVSNLAMALPFGAWWPFVPLMVTAIAIPLLNVSVNALFTAMVPDELMGRMDAVLTFASRALTPLAPVLGAFAADLVGGAVALLASGALILVTALVAAFTDLRTPVGQQS